MADAEFTRFKKLLKKNGYFLTKPRMRLFGHLQNQPALTFKDLMRLNKQHDEVTLYRNIELFEKLGIVNRLRLGWNTKIELSDIFQHHHHHFSCTSCGKVIPLPEDSLIEKRIVSLMSDQRFKATDHQLEIRGLCTRCQDNQN